MNIMPDFELKSFVFSLGRVSSTNYYFTTFAKIYTGFWDSTLMVVLRVLTNSKWKIFGLVLRDVE